MPDDFSGRSPDRVAIDITIRVGLLIVFVAIVAMLVRPFFSILIWSVILTVALYPIYAWMRARFGGRGVLASIILTVVSLVVIIGPIGLLSASLVESLIKFAAAVKDRSLTLPALPPDITSLPYVGPSLESFWSLKDTNGGDLIKHYGHTMLAPGEWLLKAVAGLAGSTLAFAFAVLITGFLYIPGPRLFTTMHDIADRILGPKGETFVSLAGATIRNVSQGIIGIAALQALVVGVVLLLLGVPHAGLLTALTLIFATVQIGAGPVTVPLVIWAWMTKDVGAALLITAAMGAVGAVEHILKPIVLGQGLRTPTLLIAVGVLGGTIVYGLPGLFVGPIALAVFYELVVVWVWPETRETPTEVNAEGRESQP